MSASSGSKPRSSNLLSDLRLVARLWPFMSQYRRDLVLSLICYLANAACVLLPPYLLQQMLDGAIGERNMGLLYKLSALYLGALILEYITGFFSEYIMSVLGQRAMANVRATLFGHVQRLSTSFFDINPSGRLQTRLTNDVEALGEVFATGVITMFSDLLCVVGVFGMMLWLNVKLTIVTLMIVPILVGVATGFQRFARHAFQRIRAMLSRINSFMAEHIAAIGMVQALGQEARTRAEFSDLNSAYRDANRNAIFADAALYAIVEAIGTSAIAVLLFFGARDLSVGTISAGVLVAFIQYIRRFFTPIRDLSTKYTVLQSAFTAAERVFSLLDAPLAMVEAPQPRHKLKFEDCLELKGVSFSYALSAAKERPEKPVPADPLYNLKDIDLKLVKGQSVGLVGSTGSGKTTLLKLLNRTYDVQKGQVLLDGDDVRDLAIKDVRRLFAVVQQEVALISGTILDNIKIAHRITQKDAEDALDVIGARDWVEQLPEGLLTPLRALGTNFSAGERQVLALARAVATKAPVVLMDEATSNIDSATEARIQRALDGLLQERTAVIVAHRLSTLQRVDRILVVDRGRIVEDGSHQMLMAQNGRYAAFVAESSREGAA